ncbi:MAG: glycine--tRNA ligase subunit beta, partial [Deltaproteobacteria bacterium]|nr:glycine--tRNA ligase subunit beta [Deltaproteobacteria bacterium]
MNKHDLLFEIGVEEIPAGFMAGALDSLKSLTAKGLEENRLGFGSITAMGTPRRLTVLATGIPEKQEDMTEEITGPPKKVAMGEDGQYTKAGLGFAKSQNADVADLKVITTPKGEYLAISRIRAGRDTVDVLTEMLPRVITTLPFPKSMRWGEIKTAFVRPIHWLAALYGTNIVPFETAGITSGRTIYGHRFMAPAPIELASPADYLEKTKSAWVIADIAERKQMVADQVAEAVKAVGGSILTDPGLLDHVTNLVEYPYAVCGSFDPKFLAIPDEVLITAMREHQKYFSVIGPDKKLMPHFVAVNNTKPKHPAIVTKGHERVLKARLADAAFFYKEDTKQPLSDRVDALKRVTFHSDLGSSYEKMERFQKLAVAIADKIAPQAIPTVDRIAYLCKADLVTDMVGEFPTLQGIMGREYARLSGEQPEVADGILEHYLPRFAGDELPKTIGGAIVSIADKVDSVVGFFAVGQKPTGGADPYALRRQSLGVINILLGLDLHLTVDELITMSLNQFKPGLVPDPVATAAEVKAFFEGRLFNLMTGRGFSHDVVDAVLAVFGASPTAAVPRITALEEFKKIPDFEPLAVAFKRVVNIIKKTNVVAAVKAELLAEEAEQDLFRAYSGLNQEVAALVGQGDYQAALTKVAGLKGAVDAF